MLEEGVSDHRHERMTVKALPGPSLEVVKTEFFFHLLVSLLADPTLTYAAQQIAAKSPSPAPPPAAHSFHRSASQSLCAKRGMRS
jgi:hypothetical protein